MALYFFQTNARHTEEELVSLESIIREVINLLQEKNLSQDEREDVLLNALSLVRGENKWI